MGTTKTDIEVPEIGESISSGILAAWLKADGDVVSEGEEIFELETDKATLAVPSPAAGALTRGAAEGDEVAVGQVVGTIDPAASGSSSDEPKSGGPKKGSAEATNDESGEANETLSPAVRRIVEENALDPASLTGTGPGGRITKADAQKAAEEKSPPPASDATSDTTTDATPESSGTSGGKSSPVSEHHSTTDARTPVSHGQSQTERTPGGQRRVPMSNLRRRIAENLVASKQSSAHVTTFNEIDMSEVMSIRSRYKESFEKKHGVRLGFMSFFVKASQYALAELPEVNAYLDGTDIVYNDDVNVGVALSSEKGLLTPVIKDVAGLGFADIENMIIDFISRANARRLKPDEMTGATFTISNGGVFGSLLSTPIPSPPQTAVLGMHAIEKRPVVVDDQVVIRPMMYAALTYDHRMVDGREAVGFLGTIKKLIEDPTRLLLQL